MARASIVAPRTTASSGSGTSRTFPTAFLFRAWRTSGTALDPPTGTMACRSGQSRSAWYRIRSQISIVASTSGAMRRSKSSRAHSTISGAGSHSTCSVTFCDWDSRFLMASQEAISPSSALRSSLVFKNWRIEETGRPVFFDRIVEVDAAEFREAVPEQGLGTAIS